MLFKNALRTLEKRYFQLLLLGVIIILSSFIYTIMDYSIQGIVGPAETFFKETNQEDFSVSMFDVLLPEDVTYINDNCSASFAALPASQWPHTVSGVKKVDDACYYGILNTRLDKIQAHYPNITLAIRESKNVYFTTSNLSYRVMYLKDMQTIDLSYMAQGSRPANDNEIAISQKFAEFNHLAIGDSFTVKDKTYTISGFVLFPDYNLALFSKELIIDNKSQTFALVTDSEFERLDENVSFEGAGVYNAGYTEAQFQTDVIDTYHNQSDLDFVSSIVLTINNLRSGGIYSDIKAGKVQGIFMSLLIASIGLMIVGIMVSRVLRSQRGPIGILKSMGYTNGQIARPYVSLIALMALPAIALGYYLGYLMAEPLKQVFLNFYLLPSKTIAQTWNTVTVAVIVPFVFIVGLSYLIIRRLLRQKPVTLLNPEINKSANSIAKRMSRVFKNLKITGKLQQLLLYRSFLKLVVYLVGMFFAAFLILLSFSMTGLFGRVLYDYYDTTNFNYIGYCDYTGSCTIPDGAEPVIEIPDVSVDNKDLTLYGIQPDSTMIPLHDKKGNLITQDVTDGVVISEAAHLGDGFNVGDQVTIQVGSATLTKTVIGITLDYTEKRIYMDITSLSETLTDTSTYYNAVYSPNALSGSDYVAVVDVNNIIKQAGNMNSFMNAFVTMMIATSVIIGAIIIYILTVMTIEDNFYNISLFKVLGYNEKEIDKMVLGGYQWYGAGMFLLTIPVGIYAFKLIRQLLARMFDLQFPIQFYWWQGVVAMAIYFTIFFFGALAAKNHLKKISLQEAMKMYEI